MPRLTKGTARELLALRSQDDMLTRILPLSLLVLVAACNSLFGPDERREVGIIQGLASDAPEIDIPAAVQAGEDFTVTIVTGWRNGCARMGETEMVSEEMAATLTPYDVVTEGRGVDCTQEPRQFTHTATLRLSQPGTARIVVRGRASDDGGVSTIQREITVQ